MVWDFTKYYYSNNVIHRLITVQLSVIFEEMRLQELREEFEKEASKTGRPRLLLTMAVPAGIEYIDKGYDIPKLNKYVFGIAILCNDSSKFVNGIYIKV